MRAYKQTVTKTEFLKELKAHQKADRFVKGRYWENGKGCAVGCSIQSIGKLKGLKLRKDSHKLYEEYLGIPEWLARVEDTIFEGVSLERSKTWPVEFAQAIKVGADLGKAKVPFTVMVLEHTLVSMGKTVFDAVKYPGVVKAIERSKTAVKQMIEARKNGNESLIRAARSAADSARSAADSARSAYSAADSAAGAAADSAYSAADSAAGAAADSAYSAADSARSAADSARSAADSAADSARSAADSARSAYSAADSAADSARGAAFGYYADQLLEILKGLK